MKPCNYVKTPQWQGSFTELTQRQPVILQSGGVLWCRSSTVSPVWLFPSRPDQWQWWSQFSWFVSSRDQLWVNCINLDPCRKTPASLLPPAGVEDKRTKNVSVPQEVLLLFQIFVSYNSCVFVKGSLAKSILKAVSQWRAPPLAPITGFYTLSN